MRHPFDLNSTELEAIHLDITTPLTDAEAAQVGGGEDLTGIPPLTSLLPFLSPGGRDPDPTEITAYALGEGGGKPRYGFLGPNSLIDFFIPPFLSNSQHTVGP